MSADRPGAQPAPDVRDGLGPSPARAPRLVLLAGVTLVPALAVVLAVASGGVVPAGSALDTGRLTRWGLPAVRVVRDLAAALAIGFPVVAATLLPAQPWGRADALGPLRRRTARLGALAAAGWVGSQSVLLVLTFSEVAGVPVSQAGGDGAQLLRFLRELDLVQSLVVSCVLAAAAGLVSAVATRVTAVGVGAVLAAAGLVPLALTGHVAGAANHDAAVDALGGHLLGVSVWLGGLAAVAAVRPLLGSASAAVVARFSRLAGWCFVLVGVSGIVSAAVRVDSLADLDSSYGALLLVKVAALGLLGTAGWWHRRRVLPLLEGSSPGRAFSRLVLGELALMGLAVAAAAALSRTPPPSGDGRVSATEALLGYPMPPPLIGDAWLTAWRVDPLWLPLALAAMLWYVGAVVRLRRRGDRWPLGRTAGWVLGCLMLIAATNGSPGVYGSVLFSMHMVQHMTVAMAVPVLLTLGTPVTLALRTLSRRTDGSWGPREWLLRIVQSRLMHLLGHPLVASGLFTASLAVFYYSPLFELSLRTHTGHTLMLVHFLVSGYLFANVICGLDPGPPRPAYPFRMVLLMAVFAFHAFFAISMMSSPVLAPTWFGALERDWGPSLQQDQYRGGAIGWALGDYPIAMLALAMVVGWVRSDALERRRYDRQAARDGDQSIVEYNAYLQQLHTGTRRPPGGAGATQAPAPASRATDPPPDDSS